VLACAALVFVIATIAMVRASAVLARHRAESAADLSALAAAGEIGVSERICSAARRIASANGARLRSCSPALSPDGRSGAVTVRVEVSVHLPLVGARDAIASARAGRAAVA
jgi:secretion/DNA translocation related TadE-like protein